MVRLQKYLAEAGVASRRASEQIILAGRVEVNGQKVHELGTKVQPGTDRVTVDGLALKPKRKVYVALNKPPGYLCSRQAPSQRKTVGDLLPKEWQHLYSVGRLDCDSEGLLFLTNDGQFSLHLTHPRYGIRKTYQVEVEGRVDAKVLHQMTGGIVDAGDNLKAEKARIISTNNTRSLLELELSEGKNREIRRLCAALELNVGRLCRIRIGPIRLGELPSGKWRTLTEPEIKSLLAKI